MKVSKGHFYNLNFNRYFQLNWARITILGGSSNNIVLQNKKFQCNFCREIRSLAIKGAKLYWMNFVICGS